MKNQLGYEIDTILIALDSEQLGATSINTYPKASKVQICSTMKSFYLFTNANKMPKQISTAKDKPCDTYLYNLMCLLKKVNKDFQCCQYEKRLFSQ